MRPADQSPASPLSAGLPSGQHLPVAVLRQYVAGALPAAEQHRVEVHTLACSRCADVLEGLTQTDLPTTDRALTELQVRLRARVAAETPDAKPVVPLWPLRQMAAAVLLLLVAAAIWLGVRRATEGPASAPQIALQLPTTKPEAAPAQSEPAAEASAVAREDKQALASAPITTSEAAPDQAPPPAVALRSARRQVLVADTESKALGNSSAEAAAVVELSGAASASSAKKEGFFAADTTQVARNTDDAALDKAAPEVYAAKAAKKKARTVAATPAAVASEQAMPVASKVLAGRITSATAVPAGMRLVRGRVTDQATGTGLPGVTVLAKGTALGASTAADGSFALLVPDSVEALTFNSIGYTRSEQALGSTDSALALALTPDTRQLNEVVVVRRERPPAPMSIGALPAGGYGAFREYLKKNLEYPEKALKDGKEGTVKLRFVVAVDGSLQDIKVVSGLSEECDAEAIRLLKEGPKWYPAISKGRRTARTVDVSVPFSVPE